MLDKYLLSFFLVLYSLVGFIYILSVPLKGDEVHYLLNAISIIKDHDIYLENNYEQRDYQDFFQGNLDKHVVIGVNGHEYLSNIPGFFTFVILPGFFILERLGATLIISLMAAILIREIYLLSLDLTRNQKFSFMITVLIGLSLPFAQYSYLLFPEITAALFITYIFRNLLRHNFNLISALFISILPWIHTRFLPVSVTFLILFIIFKPKKIWILISILSYLLFFLFFQSTFGSVLPTRAYSTVGIESTSGNIFINFLNLLFDKQYGLFINTPIYLLSISGLIFYFQVNKKYVVLTLIIVFSYLFPLLTFPDWHGGYAPPERYLTPILGLLVPFIVWCILKRFNLFVLIFSALSFIWGFSLFLTQLLTTPNHGFVYSDGSSVFLDKLSILTKLPILNLFPSFYPQEIVGFKYLVWIVGVSILLVLIGVINPRFKK